MVSRPHASFSDILSHVCARLLSHSALPTRRLFRWSRTPQGAIGFLGSRALHTLQVCRANILSVLDRNTYRACLQVRMLNAQRVDYSRQNTDVFTLLNNRIHCYEYPSPTSISCQSSLSESSFTGKLSLVRVNGKCCNTPRRTTIECPRIPVVKGYSQLAGLAAHAEIRTRIGRENEMY